MVVAVAWWVMENLWIGAGEVLWHGGSVGRRPLVTVVAAA
jgi:hypothetical protein